MNRIFISTNATLRGLYSTGDNIARTGYEIEHKKIQDLNISLLTYENPMLFYSETDKIFKTLDENSKIILINDLTPCEDPQSSFPETLKIDDKNDYILHHSREDRHINWIETESFFSKTKGMHSLRDNLYPQVFDIIFDGKDNKAERIIEFLFPTTEAILGKKLDLLHYLLVPPVDFTVAQKQWEEIKKAVKKANDSGVKVTLSSDEKALDVFVTESTSKKDAFDPEYLSALRTLRDKLLVS